MALAWLQVQETGLLTRFAMNPWLPLAAGVGLAVLVTVLQRHPCRRLGLVPLGWVLLLAVVLADFDRGDNAVSPWYIEVSLGAGTVLAALPLVINGAQLDQNNALSGLGPLDNRGRWFPRSGGHWLRNSGGASLAAARRGGARNGPDLGFSVAGGGRGLPRSALLADVSHPFSWARRPAGAAQGPGAHRLQPHRLRRPVLARQGRAALLATPDVERLLRSAGDPLDHASSHTRHSGADDRVFAAPRRSWTKLRQA